MKKENSVKAFFERMYPNESVIEFWSKDIDSVYFFTERYSNEDYELIYDEVQIKDILLSDNAFMHLIMELKNVNRSDLDPHTKFIKQFLEYELQNLNKNIVNKQSINPTSFLDKIHQN